MRTETGVTALDPAQEVVRHTWDGDGLPEGLYQWYWEVKAYPQPEEPVCEGDLCSTPESLEPGTEQDGSQGGESAPPPPEIFTPGEYYPVIIDRASPEVQGLRHLADGWLAVEVTDATSGVAAVHASVHRVMPDGTMGPVLGHRTHQAPVPLRHGVVPLDVGDYEDPAEDRVLHLEVVDLAGNRVEETLPLSPVARTPQLGAGGPWPAAEVGIGGLPQAINLVTGNGHFMHSEVTLPAYTLDLNISRSYNHQNRTKGLLGWGWRLSIEANLEIWPVAGERAIATWQDETGTLYTFDMTASGPGDEIRPHVDGVRRAWPRLRVGTDGYRLRWQSGEAIGFDEEGRVQAFLDRLGAPRISYQWQDGQLHSINNRIQLSYRENGLLDHLTIARPDGEPLAIRFTYSGENLIRVEGLAGRVAEFSYDAYHRLTGITHHLAHNPSTGGAPTSSLYWHYGPQNRITYLSHRRDDPSPYTPGESVQEYLRIDYDPQEPEAILTAPFGNGQAAVTEYRWDALGRPLRMARGVGKPTLEETFQFEGHNLTRYTDILGRQTVYAYTDNDNLVREELPDGESRTQYQPIYDSDDQIAALLVTEYLQGVVLRSFAYEFENGLLKKAVGPKGASHDTTRYRYSSDGLLEEVVDPLGYVTQYRYNDQGLVFKVLDWPQQPGVGSPEAAEWTEYEYDGMGQIKQVRTKLYDVGGQSDVLLTEYDYDWTTGILAVTRHQPPAVARSGEKATRTTTTYVESYLPGVRPVLEERAYADPPPEGEPLSAVVGRYRYNSAGMLSAATTPEGKRLYRYDAAGNLVRRISRPTPAGTDEQQSPDAMEFFVYDVLGRLVRYENPRQGQVRYNYQDQLTNGMWTLTEEIGYRQQREPYEWESVETNTYDYDLLDRPVKVHSSVKGTREFTYEVDAEGLTVTEVESNPHPLNGPPTHRTIVEKYNSAGELILEEVNDTRTRYVRTPGSNRFEVRKEREIRVPGERLWITDEVTTYTLDGRGRVASKAFSGIDCDAEESCDREIRFRYDGLDRLYGTQEGGSHSYTYQVLLDAHGRPVAETTPDAPYLVSEYAYNLYGDVRRERTGEGTTYTYQYAQESASLAAYRLEEVAVTTGIGGDPVRFRYRYSDDGYLAGLAGIGRTGEEATTDAAYGLGFDRAGHLVWFRRGKEASVIINRDPLGRVISTTVPPQGEEKRDVKVRDEGPQPMSLTAAEQALSLAAATEGEKPAGLVFDSVQGGYLMTRTHSDGTVSQEVYDADGNVVAEVDNLGRVTRYEYDALGRMTARTDPQGNTVRYTYDSLGRVLSETDPLGNTTTYRYEENGFKIIKTDAQGHETITRTNIAGQPVAVTDANGHTTRLEYDPAGQLTKVISPTGAVTRYEYEGLGRVKRIIDPRGKATVFTRDPMGRVTEIHYPDGTTESFTYNQWGEATSHTNREGKTTTYGYNESGRLASVTDPKNHTTSHVWNEKGQHIETTDARGNKTQYHYNSRGWLVKVVEPGNEVTEYRYDDVGRRTYQKDPEGNETFYEYDELGRRVRESTGDSWIAYEYDANGNLLVERHSSGFETINEYDELGRLVYTESSDGTWRAYTYDPVGNKLTETGPEGTTTYTYTPDNRVETVTTPDGHTTEYVYDPAGNIDKVIVDGQELDYDYDDLNRVTSITDSLGYTYRYEYDRDGYVTAVHLPNGLATHIEYDERHHIRRQWTEGPGGTVSQGRYGYEEREYPVQVEEDGRTFRFQYEERGQMAEVVTPRGDRIRYHYDGAGNMVRREAVIDGARVDRGETITVDDLMAGILLYLKGQEEEELEEGAGPPEGKGWRKEKSSGSDSSSGGVRPPDGGDDAPRGQEPRSRPAPPNKKSGSGWPQVALTPEVPNAPVLDAGPALLLVAAKGGKEKPGKGGGSGGGSGGSGGGDDDGSDPDDGPGKGGSNPGSGSGSGKENPGKGGSDKGNPEKGGSDSGSPGKGSGSGKDNPGKGGSSEPPGQAKKGGTDQKGAPGKGAGAPEGGAGGADGPRDNKSGKGRETAPGQGGEKGRSQGPEKARGKDQPRLKGIANALGRGKGRKLGLYRKWAQELGLELQTGLEANLLSIIDNIVNGEYLLPPGEKEELFALVREVGAGYTIVGTTYTYNDENQLISRKNWVRDEIHYYTYDDRGNLVSNRREDYTWNRDNQLVQVVFPDGEGVRYEYDALGRRVSRTTFNHVGQGQHTLYYEYEGNSQKVVRERNQDGEVVASYTYDLAGRPLTITYQGETYWYVYNAHGDVVALTDRDGKVKARYEYDEWGRLFAMYDEHGRVREGYGTIGDVGTGAPRPPIGSHPVTDPTLEPEMESQSVTGGSADSGPEAGPLPPGQAKEKPGKGKGRSSTGESLAASEPSPDETEPGLAEAALLPEGGEATAGSGTAEGEGEVGILGVIGEADDLVKYNPYRYAGYRYDRETQYYHLQARYYAPRLGRFLSPDPHPGDVRKPLTLNRYIYALNNPTSYVDPEGEVAILIIALALVAGGAGFYAGYRLSDGDLTTAFVTGILSAAAVALVAAGIIYGPAAVLAAVQGTATSLATHATAGALRLLTPVFVQLVMLQATQPMWYRVAEDVLASTLEYLLTTDPDQWTLTGWAEAVVVGLLYFSLYDGPVLNQVQRLVQAGKARMVSRNHPQLEPYAGVKAASAYLTSKGVPRRFRKQIIESFDVPTIRLMVAGEKTYAVRFHDFGRNANPKGRYLFKTFDPLSNRRNLALVRSWNKMTGIKQWRVRSGTVMITGRAAHQLGHGPEYEGGEEQWFILNPEDLLEP